MNAAKKINLVDILRENQADLLSEWTKEQTTLVPRQQALMKDSEVRRQCEEFLQLFMESAGGGSTDQITGTEWAPVKDFLESISRSRAQQGFSPTETAMFVFSLKRPLFARIRTNCGKEADRLADLTWDATTLLDRLGLFTSEVYQKSREEVIARQQQDMLELSTPVVKLWEGILALPLIGTLDSERTQVVMESLLEKITETGSEVAIIDITGVPTVDTLVAQHLIKTVTAARLMGADCIISGIRPQIAQTIVHLGVALGDVITKASLADAFVMALSMTGRSIARKTGERR